MINPIFHGCVRNDVIELDNKDRFRAHRKTLEGERIDLILRKRTSQRSDQQNRYYHGVVIKLLAEHTGYTTDEMHENLKRLFLSTKDEHGLIRIGSTATLKTLEFKDYLDRIIRWAAIDLGVPIPEPDSVDY